MMSLIEVSGRAEGCTGAGDRTRRSAAELAVMAARDVASDRAAAAVGTFTRPGMA